MAPVTASPMTPHSHQTFLINRHLNGSSSVEAIVVMKMVVVMMVVAMGVIAVVMLVIRFCNISEYLYMFITRCTQKYFQNC